MTVLTKMSLSMLSWWDSFLDTLRLYRISFLSDRLDLAVVLKMLLRSPESEIKKSNK